MVSVNSNNDSLLFLISFTKSANNGETSTYQMMNRCEYWRFPLLEHIEMNEEDSHFEDWGYLIIQCFMYSIPFKITER